MKADERRRADKNRSRGRRASWSDTLWSVLLSAVLATSLVPAASLPALADGGSDAAAQSRVAVDSAGSSRAAGATGAVEAFTSAASGVGSASGSASSDGAAGALGSAANAAASDDSQGGAGQQQAGGSQAGAVGSSASDGADGSASGNSGFAPTLDLDALGSASGSQGALGQEGSLAEGDEEGDAVVSEAASVNVSFKATVDGKEIADAVIFTDPATGVALESLVAPLGEPLSVGVEVNNPALHQIEGVCLESALESVRGFAVLLSFGNQLLLQEDGSYRSAKGLTEDAVVNVRLSELPASASASVTGNGTVKLANRGETAEAVHAASGDKVTVLPAAASGSYLAQVRWAQLPASDDESGEEGSGGAAAGFGAAGEFDGSGALEGSGEATTALVARDEDETVALSEAGFEVSASSASSSAVSEGSSIEAGVGEDGGEPLAFNVVMPDASGNYSFVMPEGEVVVYADFVPIVWDGAIDVTWYDPSATSFSISYAAQFAGLAAIVNGYFTTYPTKAISIEGSVKTVEVPDYDAFKNGMGVVEEGGSGAGAGEGSDEGSSASTTVSSEYYGEFSSVYKVATSQGAGSQSSYGRSPEVNRTMRVIGNPEFIQLNQDEGELSEDSQNLRTSDVYYYGADDFKGKRVSIAADLDFGATKTASGAWSTSSPLYMPVGGQFAMLPGYDSTNAYSILGSSWNGVLDGCGHSFSNVFCEYYASGSNYGDSVSIGLVGRMGNHDDEDKSELAVDPTVRQLVFASGYVSGRRSVGGIVGKISQTSASKLNDGSTGGIVEYCVNHADVQSTDKKGVGGIVGAAYNAGVIRHCANFGSVTSLLSGGTNAGGIAGLSEMLILSCYNVGTVSARADSFSCAITTNNGGAKVVNCYWLTGSAKGEPCYNSNEKTDTIYEFGDGADIPQLTAERLNAGSSKVWVDVVEDPCPALYYQVAGYNSSDAYSVTVVQPETGGTLSASPLSGSFADTVNLSCEPEPGYVLDYYMLNGARLSTSSFGLDGNAEVSAVFREKKTSSANVSVDGGVLPTTLTVKKDGVALNDAGVLEYVEGRVVEDGDVLYEGDVLSYEVVLDEGAAPENDALEYTGIFEVWNIGSDKQVYSRTVYPDKCMTYVVSGDEGTLEISVIGAGTGARNWSRKADISWYDEENPQESYSLSTPAQLAGLAKLVNEGVTNFADTAITLANDISLEDASSEFARSWQPIGKTGRSFRGTFDGAGHTISNLIIVDAAADNAGLFGSLLSATVRNVVLEGSSVQGSSYVAGVAAYAKGSLIENCENHADVACFYRYAGGIVGAADGKTEVVNCRNFGVVSGCGDENVECAGGIAGAVQGESLLRSCANMGEVSLAGSSQGAKAGGIAGAVANAKVLECANNVKVTGSERTSLPLGYVGGIAGAVSSGGVLIGCANTGDVEGKNLGAGGVVGQLSSPASIGNCYSKCGIVSTEKSSCNVGGLAGFAGGSSSSGGTGVISMNNCYSSSIVSGGTAGAVAGKVNVKTSIANTYYDAGLCSKAVGKNSSSGSVLETASFKDAGGAAALAGVLNGAEGSAWKADALGFNDGLPMLAWQLPYDLVFFDSAGAELARCGMPAGYTATSDDLAALGFSDGLEEANAPAGYTSAFAFWADELNGETPLTVNGAASDVEAWPSFSHELIRYSVGYELDGGVNAESNPASYTVEDDVQLVAPTRDGWRFLYWSDTEGNVVSALGRNGVLGDVSLKANWSNSASCIVTYPDNTGATRTLTLKPGTKISVEGSEDITVNTDLVVPAPTAEPDAGYRQVGYKANVSSDGSLVRMSLASFDPVPYALSLDAAGGKLPSGAPNGFTVESSLVLPQPTRVSYVFLGWYDATGKAWANIPKGTVGDLSLAAKWARDLSFAEVTGVDGSYEYTGEPIEPAVAVTHDGAQLVRGVDYEVSFENNTNVGTAFVLVAAMGDGASGTWRGEFAITTPGVTDADSGIRLSGMGLRNLKKQVGSEKVSLELNATPFSYARSSELRTLFGNAGYAYHTGFSSELAVTRVFENGTEEVEHVTDGFGLLQLSVPVDVADNTALAVYWMQGNNAELVTSYASVENGVATFLVDTLGDFALVSRQTLSDLVDDGKDEGSGKDDKKGVGMVSESAGGSGASVTAKKTEASEEKTSGAGTIDDLASKASATSYDGSSDAIFAASCDECPWCGAFGLEGLCDDLCSKDAPCPWCSAAPAVAVLLLAGAAVAVWALIMRFRRKSPDGFGY